MLDRNGQMPMAHTPGAVATEMYYDGPHQYTGYGRDDREREEGFNPLKLLFYVVQYRWLIAGLVVMGLVAGLMVTMMQTPKYRATAQLEVLVPSARVFQDMEVVTETGDVRAFLTAREKLKSRALAQRVVYQLDLSEKADFLFPTPDFSLSNIFRRAFGAQTSPSLEEYTPEQREQMAIGRVLGGLSVDLVSNTSLLSVTFRDQKPQYASEVANQVAQSFIDQRMDQTSETSDMARQFIQEQVIQVKEKLQESEQALVDYAKQAGITVTGDENSLISSNIETLNTALAAAIQERLDYGRLVRQIEEGRGASLVQVLGSEVLQAMRGNITELSAEYQQKLSLFKPGFPEMQQLQAQIREMQRQLNDGVTTITESIKLKHQETINKEADLRTKLAELEAQQIEYRDKNIQYTILRRDVDSNRSQYETLIGKLNEVGVGSALKSQNAAIVDLAVTPKSPFSPRLPINLAIALTLFMVGCAAIIYILELLNNTFTNPEQLEKELGLAVLGILPRVGEREVIKNISEPTSGLSEAYRSLRTSLQFSGSEGMPRTLLVTSAEPGEGKTTTVYKLAHDFALLGQSVLVIDGDLRKPSLHRLFGVDNAVGLSDLLTNTARREDLPRILKRTKYPNVTVMSSGTIPPNPADLLSSPRTGSIINKLAEKFNLVIVDAPPIIGLSDAPILSRHAEGTLMVVATNQITRKSGKAAIKRLGAAGARVVGAAMLKFEVNKFDYNDAYRYMNDEYYNYGTEAPKLEDVTNGQEQLVIVRSWTLDRLARFVRSSFGGLADRLKQTSGAGKSTARAHAEPAQHGSPGDSDNECSQRS